MSKSGEDDAAGPPAPVKIRYDWYQTETHVVLNILQKNINADQLQIDCQPKQLIVRLLEVADPLNLHLSHEVRPDGLVQKVTTAKLEIKLPKLEGIQWLKLEGEEPTIVKTIPKTCESLTQDASKSKSKNWDAVLKDEPAEEVDPLNELFRKIYAEGTDEVKKAMNKSFMESGGTVLSTNWGEVKEDTVPVKPPDGTEFRKWD